MTETKTCRRCREEKPLSEFNRSSRSGDGHQGECKSCQVEYSRKRYQHQAVRGHPNRLWRKFGMTLEEYDDLLVNQGGGCAICDKTPEENGKRLAVDHDHETGEIRGLLCSTCNHALGLMREDPDLLQEAADYLRDYGGDLDG